eukprot:scaffold990_cov279-Pinguiococcus_pyrenoidosus.AAC.6
MAPNTRRMPAQHSAVELLDWAAAAAGHCWAGRIVLAHSSLAALAPLVTSRGSTEAPPAAARAPATNGPSAPWHRRKARLADT